MNLPDTRQRLRTSLNNTKRSVTAQDIKSPPPQSTPSAMSSQTHHAIKSIRRRKGGRSQTRPWLWDARQQRHALDKIDRDIRLTEHTIGSLNQAKIALYLMHKELCQMVAELQKAMAKPEGIGKSLQTWLSQRIKRIDAYSSNARFGRFNLLSGTLGSRGWTAEDGFAFVMASALTKSSPTGGYQVCITQEPTPSHVQGTLALTPEVLDKGIEFMLRIGNVVVGCEMQGEARVVDFLRWIQHEIYQHQLPLVVSLNQKGQLHVRHLCCGSQHQFWVRCNPNALLGVSTIDWHRVNNGTDVAGAIHHEEALGQGSLLMGRTGNLHTVGLVVQRVFTQALSTGIQPPSPPKTGSVHVLQSSLRLHSLHEHDAHKFVLHLAPARTQDLAKGVDTTSGFTSLATMRIYNARQAMDCYTMVNKALEEINFHCNALEDLRLQTGPSALGQLKVQAQNLFAYSITKPQALMAHPTKIPSDLKAASVKMLKRLQPKQEPKGPASPLKPTQVLNLITQKKKPDLIWN